MPSPQLQVLVCTNQRPPEGTRPCCANRDGLELYRRLKDAVRARGVRDHVLVTRAGCLRHCSHGVVVAVWPENLWLGGLSPDDDVDGLLDRFLAGVGDSAHADNTIEPFRLSNEPWE